VLDDGDIQQRAYELLMIVIGAVAMCLVGLQASAPRLKQIIAGARAGLAQPGHVNSQCWRGDGFSQG
jgi:hypothetical protein